MIQNARITTERGHSWWRCPNCHQKLAEIIGNRVVIRVGERMLSLPAEREPDQVCWKCGTTSVLSRERVA